MNQDNVILIRENHSVEYGDSDAWCDKAAALCKLGRFEEALQVYDKALELNPDCFDAWWGKAAALRNLGRFEEAQIALKKASLELKMNPKLIFLHPVH